MGSSKFWVVGGEYRDTEFRELVDGTHQVVGPIGSQEEATSTWRRLTEARRGECLVRYTIAAEAH